MKESKLRRAINRWDLIAFSINSIIGAGIFGLPSKVAAFVGTSSLFAFIACAVIIILIVLCFAEVSSRFPYTGGPYIYAKEAFGPVVGFEIGWLFWIVRISGFAANTNVFVAYLAYFFPNCVSGAPRMSIIIFTVSSWTLINLIGIKQSVRVTDFFTAGKLIALFVFIIIGLFYIDLSYLMSTMKIPDSGALANAILVLVYAFTGFEMVTVSAGETRNPRNRLPFALLTAILVVAGIYFLIQLVCLGTLRDLSGSEKPVADASRIFLGSFGGTFITIGALISIFGSLNSSMIAAPRVLFAMAVNRQLPKFLSATHRSFQTPHYAILLTSLVMLVFTVQSSFITALTISTIVRLLIYTSTCGSLVVFRRRKTVGDAMFLLPGGIFVATLSLGFIGWLLINVDYKKEGLYVIFSIVLGFFIYLPCRFMSAKIRDANL